MNYELFNLTNCYMLSKYKNNCSKSKIPKKAQSKQLASASCAVPGRTSANVFISIVSLLALLDTFSVAYAKNSKANPFIRSYGNPTKGNSVKSEMQNERRANDASKKIVKHQQMLFKIHYAKASHIADLITKSHGFLSESGAVAADSRTNSIWVNDEPNRIKMLEQYLHDIDIPVKQVMIEARIVYADEAFGRELGLKFESTFAANTKSAEGMNMDLPVKTYSPGNITLAIAKLGDGVLLDMELSALESEGRGKVISKPKLVTANRESAYIEAGDEVPYQEKTSSGATSLVFKKAVLGLKVTPELTDNNQVNLKLQLNQDKVNATNINGEPTIQTRQIQTQILVNNGQTAVLGGIYEESTSHVVTKIPFLGSIPLVGLLFQNNQSRVERKELLIFVTPIIS